MGNVTVRRVRKGDQKTLAYIQTQSWKAAFAEILPADVLARCADRALSERMYAGLIEAAVGNGYILEVDGRPHCIAYWDTTRERDMAGYAELICIHSLPDKWHCGYGSEMMARVLDDMRAAGFGRVMLWVFEANHRAIEFYRKHGFAPNGRAQPAFGVTEVMYERAL